MSKVSKASVHYRPAQLFTFQRRCGTCAMYRAGGSCTLVKGDISRLAVRDRWTPQGKLSAYEYGQSG